MISIDLIDPIPSRGLGAVLTSADELYREVGRMTWQKQDPRLTWRYVGQLLYVSICKTSRTQDCKIVCDETQNTPETVKKNEVRLSIYWKGLEPGVECEVSRFALTVESRKLVIRCRPAGL